MSRAPALWLSVPERIREAKQIVLGKIVVEMPHLREGKAPRKQTGDILPKQPSAMAIKSCRLRDPASTLTLKVPNPAELCSIHPQVPGTPSASGRGLVRSYYRGPPLFLLFACTPGAGGPQQPPARPFSPIPHCPLVPPTPFPCCWVWCPREVVGLFGGLVCGSVGSRCYGSCAVKRGRLSARHPNSRYDVRYR